MKADPNEIAKYYGGLGYGVCALPDFAEPHIGLASYYSTFEFSLSGNLSVRRPDVLALEAQEDSQAFALLQEYADSALRVKMGRKHVFAFSFDRGFAQVQEGPIVNGRLASARLVTSGFLIHGRVWAGAAIVEVETSGKAELLPQALAEILVKTGRYSVASYGATA